MEQCCLAEDGNKRLNKAEGMGRQISVQLHEEFGSFSLAVGRPTETICYISVYKMNSL
jgi:hypothetical protein